MAAAPTIKTVNPHDPEYRLRAILFNDVSKSPAKDYVTFSDRRAIADFLYEQGWRREERPEDITT